MFVCSFIAHSIHVCNITGIYANSIFCPQKAFIGNITGPFLTRRKFYKLANLYQLHVKIPQVVNLTSQDVAKSYELFVCFVVFFKEKLVHVFASFYIYNTSVDSNLHAI